jgi:predicted aspartyl protease
MINLKIENGLLFCEVMVKNDRNILKIPNVLVDTGSAGTIFKTEVLEEVGIKQEPADTIEVIRGIGGNEFVFIKKIDEIQIGEHQLNDFLVEVGAMDYGIKMNGIVGLDLLMSLGITIDLEKMKMY